jgi:hypothetical protein
LGISAYSLDLLLAVLAFAFVGMVLRTKANRGAVRAVSNFFLNIFGFCVIAVILIWVLGWLASLQHSSIPAVLPHYIPDLVIAALVAVILSYLIRQFAPKSSRVQMVGRPMLVSSGSSTKLERARITAATDGVAVPLGQEYKDLGYVLMCDVQIVLDTPMGARQMTLKSPVSIYGVPLPAKRINERAAQEITGKSWQEIFEAARSALPESGTIVGSTVVDLPFIHVRENGDEEMVQVGPINVKSDRSGEHVKIGPFEFDDDGEHSKKSSDWYLISASGSTLASRNKKIYARWNGSSMLLKDDYMRLRAGSDRFEYDPQEVITSSPLHKLRVTKNNVSLETARFTITIQEGKVVVREQNGKMKSSDSEELASDLKSAFRDLAAKQVKDVMACEPIDFGELLEKTEEVLQRYE